MNKEELLLPKGCGWDRVPLASILYIKSDHKLRRVFTSQGEYLVSSSLTSLLERLPADRFLRIHKSYVVALASVKVIGKREVQVADRRLPVARRAASRMNERFMRCN